jgi:hypothetical protein
MKRLVYFLAIWYVLRQFGTFCGYFGNLVAIWYISPNFGILRQEKSGNPGGDIIERRTCTSSLVS